MSRRAGVATRVLRLAIGDVEAEVVVGDLEEGWAERRDAGTAWVARALWYWTEVARCLRPATARAMRYRSFRGRRGTRGFMAALFADLRFALRAIARAPAFAALAALTIGFGIAATTVVVSAVDGLVLNPFPFPDGRRLVGVGTAHPKLGIDLTFVEHMSPAEYLDIAGARSLEHVVAWDMGNRQVTFGDATENLFSGFWWGDGFRTLGVEPHLGRGFAEDEIRGQRRVAVLSYRVWRDRFGADSAIVGKPVLVNGDPYEVVGVMPPRTLIYGMDLWIPMPVGPEVFPRGRRQFQVLSRLAPGVTLAAANAELEVLAGQVEAEHRQALPEYEGWRMEARTWADINVAALRPAALVLLGAVAFVMLLVSTNVTTLLLGRSEARARELAVRSALGAGRQRLVRQLVTESLVLAGAGLALGVALGALGIGAVRDVMAALSLPVAGELALNARVLVASAAVAVAAGVGFGSIPALHVIRRDVHQTLQSETGGATGAASRLRMQRMLIGFEAALALALVAGSGYLIHSFVRLSSVDPGFAPANVLTMRLTLAQERYPRAAIEPFFATLRERVAAIPGVRGVGTTSQFPPAVFGRLEFRAEGLEMPVTGARPTAYATLASPGYLETIGARLVRGRPLEPGDREGAPFVGVINEALAARYFPGQDPLGRRIQLGDPDDPWVEVVGVVASTRNRGLDQRPEPELFASTLQLAGFNNQMFLLVRTDGDPYAVLPAIRQAVRSLDPEQPVYAVRTIEQAFDQSQFRRRFSTTLLGLFGGFALLLAAVGIYGVVSYATSQRTREVGVRMALGANRAAVTRLFVGHAMIPVAVGALVGAFAAFGVGRAMASLLFEVDAGDPLTIGAAALVLALVGGVAAWVPARRASGLDPVRALRVD